MEGMQPKNFSKPIDAIKTGSLSLQRTRAILAGEEEPSGSPATSAEVPIAVFPPWSVFFPDMFFLPFFSWFRGCFGAGGSVRGDGRGAAS